jgi:uncharacterized protein YrrD
VADEKNCGDPIAYLVLEPGTPVYAADGNELGTVERVLFVPDEDIFEGLVVATSGGSRLVEADAVERIFQRCVFTSVDDAQSLPEPDDRGAVYRTNPAEEGWLPQRGGQEQR